MYWSTCVWWCTAKYLMSTHTSTDRSFLSFTGGKLTTHTHTQLTFKPTQFVIRNSVQKTKGSWENVMKWCAFNKNSLVQKWGESCCYWKQIICVFTFWTSKSICWISWFLSGQIVPQHGDNSNIKSLTHTHTHWVPIPPLTAFRLMCDTSCVSSWTATNRSKTFQHYRT